MFGDFWKLVPSVWRLTCAVFEAYAVATRNVWKEVRDVYHLLLVFGGVVGIESDLGFLQGLGLWISCLWSASSSYYYNNYYYYCYHFLVTMDF